MNENFFQLLLYAFSKNPDGPALLLPEGREISYRELAGQSAASAQLLDDLGVSIGDRVLVQTGKSPEAVSLYLGCLRAGAVYVPINTAYTLEEVAYFLADAEPALFVCDPADEEGFRSLVEERSPGTTVRSLGSAGEGSLIDALRGVSVDALNPSKMAERAGDDLAAILYTSGTTGRSKGAMLTHANLATSSVMLVDYWGWQEDDVLLHALPIFHVHGLFIALHCAMLKATPMIFMPSFDAATVLAELPRATVMMGVPTFYTRLLSQEGLNAELCAHMRLFLKHVQGTGYSSGTA
jgi:malonyl-CoA/methylmalonyl-CoA synthetase